VKILTALVGLGSWAYGQATVCNRLEARMTDMQGSIDRLRQAVESYQQRTSQRVEDLEGALRTEREIMAALVQAEEDEDQMQNEELRRAREQTDEAMAQVREGGGQLDQLARQLETSGPGAQEDGGGGVDWEERAGEG
jgi:TolA-binding protein